MLSLHGRGAVRRVLDPVGRFLAAHGVSPDLVTTVGTLGVVVAALAFYPRGEFFLGTVVITLFIFSDMIDGAVARARGGGGRWGAFLDSTLDRVGDAAIFGGLLLFYADAADVLHVGLVAYCLVAGALVSYIKARAEGLGLRCDVGLAERPERLLIVLIATGLSGIFDAPVIREGGLWLLAAASTVTIGQRLWEVRRQAAGVAPADGADRAGGATARPRPEAGPR